MNKTKAKNPSLKDLFDEVRALRRDVALMIPTESLSDYKHPKRLMTAYKKAITEHPIHADRSNR